MPHVNVTKNYTIDIEGTEDAYVQLGDVLAWQAGQGGLDSLDAGDATGAVLAWADRCDPEQLPPYVIHDPDLAIKVTIDVELDLFKWTEKFDGQR